MPNVDLNTITQGVEKNALIDLLVRLFGKLFPNKIVLDRLSSIEGSLAYNGQKIPTDTYTKAEIDELLENLPEAGFTPIGTIIALMGNTAPTNYLACNGQTVNIADYVELADYFKQQFGSIDYFGGDGTTTFGIPDLRGEFLRGTGANSHTNQGSGSNVGEHQDGTEHLTIENDGSYLYSRQTTSSTFEQTLKKDSSILTTARHWRGGNGNGGYTVNNFGLHYTSRPTNTSVLYCIATKNIYVDAKYDYSFDEKVIGTWVDGKPLYQKTIKVASVNSWQAVYTVQNADFILITNAMYYVNDNTNHWLLAGYYSGTSARTCLGIRDNKIMMTVEGFGSSYIGNDHPMLITIQYTKTTD